MRSFSIVVSLDVLEDVLCNAACGRATGCCETTGTGGAADDLNCYVANVYEYYYCRAGGGC